MRDFATAAPGLDDAVLRSFFSTMLREIGEALSIDCCAMIMFPGPGRAPVPAGAWTLADEPGLPCPLDSPAFESLAQELLPDRNPIILQSAPADGDGLIASKAKAFLQETGIGSALLVPIVVARRVAGTWLFGASSDSHVWPDAIVEHLQTVGDLVAGVACPRRQDVAAADALSRLPVKARSAPPIRKLPEDSPDQIVGESPALRAALDRLEEVVDTDCSVLLLGETGTGKELFARALHAGGPRSAHPLVSVNCAALPPTLIESELFGHQRGAFTGAIAPRQGRFEIAHRGTLFLDEIGDLPMDLQAKLLRVLQEGGFERVGSSQTQAVDVRIIGATHRDLARAVNEGTFRADLYYRLNVFPIRLPTLRERREDIPALVWSIIRRRQPMLHRHITTVPAETMAALQQHGWPGNIRELQNVVERMLIRSAGETLLLPDGSLETLDVEPVVDTLTSVERVHIQDVLRDCGWRINGLGNAAERLGLHPNTLRFRMKKLGIIRHKLADPPHMRAGRASAG